MADSQQPETLRAALRQLDVTTKAGEPWCSAAMLSRTLRDVDGINVHWRTLTAVLRRHSDLVATRKSRGQLRFSIMTAGRDRIGGTHALLIDPTAAVQATVKLHDLLSGLKGMVRICDPYLDVATIEHLDAIGATRIALLTEHVKDSGTLRRTIAALNQTRPTEVRVGTGLHDRYVIDDTGLLLMGGSLNGFGKRQMFVTKGGSDLRAATLAAFDGRWHAAKPWP